MGSGAVSKPNRGLGEFVPDQLAEVASSTWEGAGRANQHTAEAPSILLEDILVLDFGCGYRFFVEEKGWPVTTIISNRLGVLLGDSRVRVLGCGRGAFLCSGLTPGING